MAVISVGPVAVIIVDGPATVIIAVGSMAVTTVGPTVVWASELVVFFVELKD